MKKLLLISLLAFSVPVMAQHHHGMRHFDHHHHQHRQSNWGWVAPAVIGGAVVYGLTRPDTVIVQQPPVYIQQPNIVIIDGVTYVRQTMIINGISQEVLIKQ
jgi:hypothetical protein